MAFPLSRRKQGRNVLYIYKKRRCDIVNSYVNSSQSNHFNTSNSDNVIVNSNLPIINVQTKSSLNTLITFPKSTDIQSSIIINDEIIYKNNISEEISSRHDSAGLIDHTCDDNGKHLLNTEEEVEVTSINSINATNEISINDDDNFIHK